MLDGYSTTDLVIANLVVLCLALLIALLRARAGRRRAHEKARMRAISARQERSSAAFARIASEATDDGLVIQDLNGKILWVNPAYCRILGYQPDEIIGRNPMEFAYLPSQKPSDTVIENFRYNRNDPNWGRLSLYRNMRKTGEAFWNQIRVSYYARTTDTDDDYVVLVCRDVSAQVDQENALKEKSAKLLHLAERDALTGVANRIRMTQFADDVISRAALDGSNVGVLQLDLNKFKAINDTHGHAAGDAVLKHVATQIYGCLQKSDLVARLGGDEFVVICPQAEGLGALKQLSLAIVQAVRIPMTFEGANLQASVSIGVAISMAGADTLQSLLKHSDLALYEAKRGKRGQIAAFDDGLRRRYKRDARRSDELLGAIQSRELSFYFQPVIRLDTKAVMSMEALLRWEHPVEGTLLPDQILPLAENIGVLAQIDQLAFEAAVSLQAQLQATGWTGLRTCFNASEAFLTSKVMQASLADLPGKTNIHPSDLIIEVKDSFCIGDGRRPGIARRLQNLGYELILDGCNASFAGLMQLEDLRIRRFKTDRGIAGSLVRGGSSAKLLARLFQTASDLDLEVAVVGIETSDQFEIVGGLSRGTVQGDLISPPIPAREVISWLARRSVPGQPVFIDL